MQVKQGLLMEQFEDTEIHSLNWSKKDQDFKSTPSLLWEAQKITRLQSD